MASIRITGWRVGLDTVRAIKEIRSAANCNLAEAKNAVERMLGAEEVFVNVSDQGTADRLVNTLTGLGIIAETSSRQPSGNEQVRT